MNDEYSIYLRKSRKDVEAELRGEGETLARHEKILLELACRKKLKIGKIYKEIVSGETISARPEVQKLLSDVKNRKWKGVLVVEVERLARGETIDQGLVAEAFKISNTKIVTPMKIYDPSNEFDEEYFEFGLFMSRREYKTIKRRLQTGRAMSANEGKYVGSIPPFGYDRVKIKNDKGYTLKINEESKTVKTIFNLYAYDNLSLNEVTRQINNIGLKPRKLEKWTLASVKEILSNPVYIGKIRWNARKEVKVYKNERIIKTRPRNNEYVLVNGMHQSIIDEETWKIVQNKRSLNMPPVKHNDIVKNPLAGIIKCAKCGGKMVRRPYNKNGKDATLICQNSQCDNVSSKLYLVEQKVVEGLKIWLNDYKFNYADHIKNIRKNENQIITDTINSLESELKKENDKLMSIYNFFEDGTYTRELFKARLELVSKNIEKIESSINEYRLKLEQEENISKNKKMLIPEIENILDIYDMLDTVEEKNNLLKTVLSEVTYLKTEKSIRKDSDPTNFTITLFPKISAQK